MRYFKKIYPQNPVEIGGKNFLFPATAAGFGLLAVDPTKRPDLIRAFERFIADRNRGGITEISQQEFDGEKKKTPQPPRASEALSPSQVSQLRRHAERENAALADKERAKRQLTPTISRSFKRPGMKYAGATANPTDGGTQPGQWRPGITER